MSDIAISYRETELVFQGAFYEIAPLNIPLCLSVLVQNSVIIISYYKDRAKIVPSLFMGIAAGDIVKAQGDLVLTVMSILVHYKLVNPETLYKSLSYYMATALPGFNCSKLFNLVLTVILTVKIRNPFHIINTSRLRKLVAILCLVIILLHISDTVVASVKLPAFNHETVWSNNTYTDLITMFEIPAAPTAYLTTGNYKVLIPGGAVFLVAPPIIVLVCMIIQLKYVRQSLPEQGDSSKLPDTGRHVSITILMVSVLFFICHSVFLVMVLIWNVLKLWNIYYQTGLPDKRYIGMGIFVGLSEFSLPLVYAALYPVIIICRKQELREQYRQYISRVFACCRYDNRN